VSIGDLQQPRIAIVGSCQVAGLSVAIEHLLPGSRVKAWHFGVDPETADDIAARLPEYDCVISQLAEGEGAGALDMPHLRESLRSVMFLPILVFRGFHPDCVYLHSARRGLVKGCLGDLHSGIVAACYVLRVPERRIPNLFNSLTFAALGYFDAFELAREHLLERFRGIGFDLTSRTDAWLREYGAFMYTPNHPKLGVITELAKMILQRAGFGSPVLDVPVAREDPLASSVQWPIYPDLARRLKLPGSLTYVQQVYGLEPGAGRETSLPQLVEQSYRIYADIPMQEMRELVPADIVETLDRLLAGAAAM
jgi:hypothetical protein